MNADKAPLFVSTILPEGARKLLQEAARTKCSLTLDKAIDKVKLMYPEFFKHNVEKE